MLVSILTCSSVFFLFCILIGKKQESIYLIGWFKLPWQTVMEARQIWPIREQNSFEWTNDKAVRKERALVWKYICIWSIITHMPKPTCLASINDWKAHTLNHILGNFQLCQTNHSLSGSCCLKKSKSKLTRKRENFFIFG